MKSGRTFADELISRLGTPTDSLGFWVAIGLGVSLAGYCLFEAGFVHLLVWLFRRMTGRGR